MGLVVSMSMKGKMLWHNWRVDLCAKGVCSFENTP
jgi:hypothetical protein